MRVFISSTALDLASIRRVAEGVVLEHGWQPVMVMEHRSVAVGPSVQACQGQVNSCDIFLLLVGHRCGWIPPTELGGDGVSSITQIEFMTWLARSRVQATIAPLVLMTTDPPPAHSVGEDEDELNAASQVVFRARLKSGLFVHEFQMPAEPGPSDVSTREFRSLLMSLLSKIKADIAARTEAVSKREVQMAKSNGWAMGALGLLGGILLASGTEERQDEADDWG